MLMNHSPQTLKKIGFLSALLLTGLIQGVLIISLIPNQNFDYPNTQESQ
jgi:hypothetical protein